MTPDIRTARLWTRALLNYADNLRAIDADRYGTIAEQIGRMAQPAFDALDDSDDAIILDMVGHADE